jgi:hypothetical protein
MANDGRFTLNLVRGDDTTIVVNFVDEDNEPIDLTGRSYSAMIRKRPTQTGSPNAEFTCTITNAGEGELTLTLSATDQATLVEDCYWTDLQEIYNGQTTTILLPGKLTLTQDVTHA